MLISGLPASLATANLNFPALGGNYEAIQAPQAMAPLQALSVPNFGAITPPPTPQGMFSRGIDALGGPSSAFQAGVGALQTIGDLWGAYQANKLAKQQFNYVKGISDTNLANSIQSYNTTLADRARARAVVEGQSDAQRDKYIADNSLRDRRN